MIVLLADPSPANRRQVMQVLAQIGAEPVEADWNDAIALVEARMVDAVVTDLVLPGAERFPIWRALRQFAQGRGIRFIVYVGRRPAWMREEELRGAGDAVLMLPVEAGAMVDALIGAPSGPDALA